MEKNNKSIGRDISGWIIFFLFQTGLSAIILVIFSNFELPINHNFSGKAKLFCAICMVLPVIFIIVYTIFFIHSFIRRKSFTIHLGMSYLFALFLYVNGGLVETLLRCNDGVLCNLLENIIGMMWFAGWMSYLYQSKKLEILFPESGRISRKRDILPIILIAIPPLIRIFGLFYLKIYNYELVF